MGSHTLRVERYHRHAGVEVPRVMFWLLVPAFGSCYDNVYGAVIMTKIIVSVHPVHLMNAD